MQQHRATAMKIAQFPSIFFVVLTLMASLCSAQSDLLYRNGFEPRVALTVSQVAPELGSNVASDQILTVSVFFDYPGATDQTTYALSIDGVAIDSCSATLNSIVCELGDGLPPGLHAVDVVYGKAVYSWTFSTVTRPAVVDFEPASDVQFGTPLVVRARIIDIRADLDVATLDVTYDLVNITTNTVVTVVSPREIAISYTPTAAQVSASHHLLSIAMSSQDEIRADQLFDFEILPQKVYTSEFEVPTADAIILVDEINAVVSSTRLTAAIRKVEINNSPALYLGGQGAIERYGRLIKLLPGANVLRAKVTFTDDTVREFSRTVTYDAPPVVTIISPRDWETFGLATSINGAPVSGNASNLTGLVDRPISITGTVSKAVASVSINQQAATLAPDGKSFTFNNFFLREGTSLLSVNATDSSGRISSANVTVFVDQTAPLLSIENPVNDAVTSSNRIDVRGIANDAVEGGLGAAEPVVTVQNAANQQSITAIVSDRYYFATDIPLEVGANDLTVTATDQRGNARSQSVRVVRIAVGSKRITLLGGNRQSAPVKSELPQALQISAIDAQGNPLAYVPVRFDIVRGNGSISLQSGAPTKPNGVNPARNLLVNTDNSGVAKLWLTLGSESSPGGNSVRAWSPDIAEDTIFTATGTRGAPYWVVIDGNASAQFVQTGTAPVDALQSAVYDQNYNRMVATPVRYRILSGAALFTANSAQTGTVSADGQTITVLTDKDGRASVRPIAGETPGIVKIISEAVLPNNAIAGQALFQLTVLERRAGPTKFRGVVMSHTGKPLAGVRFSIARTNLSATSDSNGKFEFTDQVPPGKIDLFVDGRTVTSAPNIEYPALHFETAIIPGQDNQLPHAIYLPPVNLSASQIVGGNQDVTLTIPGYEGFELIVKANSVTFPDGSHTGPLVVSPVHNDRLPMVPPGGAATFGTLGWTIQPTGTRFDPPAQVKIPNPGHMTAGQTAQIVQWDHDLATFVPMGQGTVNEDASQIITDFGSGITKAGWGGCPGPACPPDLGFPQCGEGGPTCRGSLCGCNSCQLLSTAPQGTCPICQTDPIKESAPCESNACKWCVSGKCEQRHSELPPLGIKGFNFTETIKSSNIANNGVFYGFESERGGAVWEFDVEAYCSSDGNWRFALVKADIKTVIAINYNRVRTLTSADIVQAQASPAQQCSHLNSIELALHTSATSHYSPADPLTMCLKAPPFSWNPVGSYNGFEGTVAHERIHELRFKKAMNNVFQYLSDEIFDPNLSIADYPTAALALDAFNFREVLIFKQKEIADNVRLQLYGTNLALAHSNPNEFYLAKVNSAQYQNFFQQINSQRTVHQCPTVPNPNVCRNLIQ